jgi:hypothetical protein
VPSDHGDTLLFSFAAGIAFGIWYGVNTLFEVTLGTETEGKFALAATVSAVVCVCVHEFFFTVVPRLEARFGGRVIYKWVGETPWIRVKSISFMRDTFGGVIFLGVTEAAVAALPKTENRIFNVLRVTGSYILGFFVWYL